MSFIVHGLEGYGVEHGVFVGFGSLLLQSWEPNNLFIPRQAQSGFLDEVLQAPVSDKSVFTEIPFTDGKWLNHDPQLIKRIDRLDPGGELQVLPVQLLLGFKMRIGITLSVLLFPKRNVNFLTNIAFAS